MRTHLFRRRLLATTIMGGALALPITALAAETTANAGDAAAVEEVIVTGSRIARPNQDSPVPVSVITAQHIEATGQMNTGDILRTLPETGASAFTPTNSTFATANNGVTTVELRNLGENRTLVLVNGRRHVAGIVGSQTVDFNTVPTDFIERVDVVTGAASAVYGSDALAGVINIITQTSFEGLELSGQGGITDRGDNENFKLALKFGSNFADDRGNFVGVVGWRKTGAVYARDRCDRNMCIDSAAATARRQTEGVFSSYIPRGTALIPRVGAGNLTRVVNDTGVVVPYTNAAFGYNRAAQRQLFVPEEQLRFNGQITFDFNENHRFFSEVSVFHGRTQSELEGNPLGSETIYQDQFGIDQLPDCRDFDGDGDNECRYGVPITSAVVPVALANAVRAQHPGIADQDLVVGFRRRISDVGNRGNESERSMARVVFGFKGDLTESLGYEFSVNYGRSDYDQRTNGDVITDRFEQALDAIVVGGEIVCRDTAARAQGCRPAFVFREGGISKDALKYFTAATGLDAFQEQYVVSGFVDGALPSLLPAGDIGFVVGAEYREESARSTPDPLTQMGLATGNITPETRGAFNVSEAFAELRIPLLANLPFAEALDLNLAGRLSDYSTVGSTTAWAASAEYLPTSWLKLRSQYAVAVRAPNINELYNPGSQTFPQVGDPCEGVTLSGGQAAFLNVRSNIADPSIALGSGVNASTIGNAVARACMLDPAVAARVARDGGFALSQPEAQGLSGFNTGNPDLTPETSKTFTAGFLFNPRWNDWWTRFSLSVDYYDISIQKGVGTYGRQVSLNRCYESPTAYDPASPFCGGIQRFSGGASVGALQYVNIRNLNLAEIKVEGLDVKASYSLDLNDLFSGQAADLGKLAASLTYSHLLEFNSVAFPGAAPQTFKGVAGSPEHEAVLNLLYARGPLQMTVGVQYVGEADVGFFDPALESALPSMTFVNAQARYEVNDRVNIYAGVDNIFDEYMFIAGTNGDIGQTTGWTTFPEIYDGLGRRFYGGFRLSF
ncbi:TonB-dependent receptor plug domain-containing protein [Caulobacter mirabilis]|uniref:TonB-dependent receptor plug domain-containing protein n=1 Tax=Caulobacter mirabilis TaxID=69666 RepID=UPI001559FBE3|nr:TonB-dependent receptor [Caulobacter mirabilis]